MSEDDWRLDPPKLYLMGATLERKRYRAPSETWDHDHCSFCWGNIDDFTDEGAPHQVAYAVQGRSPNGGTRDDYWWVCPQCLADFRERYEWTVIEHGDPPLSRTTMNNDRGDQ